MSDIPERPQTILVTIHESTRSIIERVYLAFAMDDWISKFAIEKNKRIATLEAQLREREQEIERLRAINEDLTNTHNTLVIENSRLRTSK